jgi:hypothetical protein
MTPTQTDLAWAAGIVDGEGCISIRRAYVAKDRLGKSRTSKPQYALYLAVGNTDPRMPQKLCDMFGGSLVNKTRQQVRRPIFEWRVFASNAGRILAEIRPYLVIKGEQADIALAFAATLKRTGQHSAEVHAARAIMKEQIRVLKREEVF